MFGWLRRPIPEPAPHPDRIMQSSVRSRFVVTLHGGETIEGLLVEADDRVIVLIQASQVTPGGTRVNVDGAVYLERREVAYLQRPDGVPAPGADA